jgi:hypothetical protein
MPIEGTYINNISNIEAFDNKIIPKINVGKWKQADMAHLKTVTQHSPVETMKNLTVDVASSRD